MYSDIKMCLNTFILATSKMCIDIFILVMSFMKAEGVLFLYYMSTKYKIYIRNNFEINLSIWFVCFEFKYLKWYL
jgi:hypothetical protein